MTRLNELKRKILTKADFDKYSIWVWDDEMENKVPISDNEPSRYDFGAFFIKCRLIIDNRVFEGYVIGNESYYAVGLFIDHNGFILNVNTPDLLDYSLLSILTARTR